MNRYRLALAATVCCGLSLYFLSGKSQQPVVDVAERTVEASKPDNGNSTTAPEVEQVATAVEDQSLEQVVETEAMELAFEPPFPDRTNLFQAPKRQGRGSSKSSNQSETAVELLGFVNVNGQRVALSIDGLVTTIAEGGQAYGIEVISIQPPSVFLRRGKQRWQASFEN